MAEFEFVEISVDGPLLRALQKRQTIGLDTEFMREKTFFAQLCLVQIAVAGNIYCADPLTDNDLLPFWNRLMPCSWVVHSARQDIEVIYQTAQQMPAAIFDTQIAAALLGYPPQMGYASLVAELFDTRLAKTHTRADWSRRPLPHAAIEYAAEDVAYLLPAFEVLSARLQKAGRLEWAQQDSADLLDPALYDNNPQLAVRRLKGAVNLRGSARAAATGLAAWRESEALRSNRPRQWIMKDSVLLEIAVTRPGSVEDLLAVPGIAERTMKRAADQLLDLLATARTDSNGYEPPRRPDAQQKVLLSNMQQKVAACANELAIAAEVIAAKKDLAAALAGDRSTRLFRGWRRELIGEVLLEMLQQA